MAIDLYSKATLDTLLAAKLGDAPSDGSQYARQNGAWAVITGGGGGVAWGTITGTVTDQTDLVTYVTGLGYQTSSDVSTYVAANAYPLSSNPAGYLTGLPAPSVTNVDMGVGNYTLVLADGGNTVNVNAGDGSSSGYVIYIPDNASVAFPVGTQVLFTCSMSSGSSYNYINGASGVTVIQTSNGLNAGFMRRAVKLDTDTWMISSQI